jgi:hypothetical protein
MAKPNITRTYGPIHFEDLDPHRFEDLVRELIYDYKDWQSIEATGRSGSDEGFDVRAYERIVEYYTDETDIDTERERNIHPMDGNLWMIQCKREKEIGPTKISNIISDCISIENPPYGYILVAPANFSKKSFDKFREELKNRGVMEFHLWGEAALEDMLHMPKFDRILFTFFGISLVTKKRNRSTEIRSIVATKNKLFKVFEEKSNELNEILFRDINDTNYPKENAYPDFSKNPRWLNCYFRSHIGTFMMIDINLSCYAYVDIQKKEWDYFEASDINIANRNYTPEKFKEKRQQENKAVELWNLLPQEKKKTIRIVGLIKYSDILVVDEKGDSINDMPHLYIDFNIKNGPFEKVVFSYNEGSEEVPIEKEKYKRIKIF